MAVTITQKKSWDVEVEGVNGNRLIATSSPDESARGSVFTVTAKNSSGFIDISMTPDDFSRWSAFVLARLREEGWRPKR
jgi:hypothetical protein